MIKIGEYNDLVISRIVDFGVYLAQKPEGDNFEEVLLPGRYVTENMKVGDELRVFVYTDSEDRPVTTTETPFAKVGEFAFLQTVQVNKVGAFMDWGLQKNILVPFKEQKIKMFPGGIYLVYVYLDNNTKRVVASAKIEKFLGNVFPDYKNGQKVKALIYAKTELGYQAIVDNLHKGLIYFNETYQNLEIGQEIDAFIKNVRENDGKIDLTLIAPGTLGRIEKIAKEIIDRLKHDSLDVNEDSTPEEIKNNFHCSKKDFKKAISYLYKDRVINFDENKEIILTK